jgi:hypothetical protein
VKNAFYPAISVSPHIPEGIQPAQRGLAEAFGSAFPFRSTATLNDLTVGGEPLLNHGPAPENNALGEVPHPARKDFRRQTPLVGSR